MRSSSTWLRSVDSTQHHDPSARRKRVWTVSVRSGSATTRSMASATARRVSGGWNANPSSPRRSLGSYPRTRSTAGLTYVIVPLGSTTVETSVEFLQFPFEPGERLDYRRRDRLAPL